MAFSFYRALTIDYTKCGSVDSTSFPVLVSIFHTTLKDTANGGNVANLTTGYDIVFTSDSAGTTKLPWEVESYDCTTGTLVAWVNIATVSHTVDTTFYLFYGDVALNVAQNTGSFAPTAVWDTNYKGVWHLPDGNSLTMLDSTGVNNGSGVGSPTAAAGKIGGGVSLNGSSQAINVGNNSSQNTGSIFTLSAWIQPSNLSGRFAVYSTRNTAAAGAWQVEVGFQTGVAALQVTGPSTVIASTNNNTITTASLQYITVIKNGGGDTVIVYINGAVSTIFSSNVYTVTDNAANKYIGSGTSGAQFFPGVIDEVRLSNIVRSANWILTEYNNQNAPGNIGSDNFIKFGIENSIGGGGGGVSIMPLVMSNYRRRRT